MGNGGAGDIDLDHMLLGILQALANGLGDLSGLAQAVADIALTVANDHQGGEFHDTAALHGLADAVQIDELFDILALGFLKSRHFFSSSDQNCRPPSRAPSARALTRP